MISNEDAVAQVGKWMNAELVANEPKGDWLQFTNTRHILGEIQHHHRKVEAVLNDPNGIDPDKLREHIADTCNCYLFLANANHLLDTNMRNLKELNNNELNALEKVHNAIYLGDNSDYRTALYEALCALLGTEWDDAAQDYPSGKNYERIQIELEHRKTNPVAPQAAPATQWNVKTAEYVIHTGMGKMHQNTLPFLDGKQFEEFNTIGYSGRTSNGAKTSREEYLNTLGKGRFEVVCLKGDNGDFSETFKIIQTVVG